MKTNLIYKNDTPIILNDTRERNPLHFNGKYLDVNLTSRNLKNAIFGNTAFKIFKTESQKKREFLEETKKRNFLYFPKDVYSKERRNKDFQELKELYEPYLTGRIREYTENGLVKIFYPNDFHTYESYFKPVKTA